MTSNFSREKKEALRINFDLARKDLKMICVQMIKLRSLWVLILSIGIRRLAASVVKTYLPGYLRNRYPGVEEMDKKYELIFGASRRHHRFDSLADDNSLEMEGSTFLDSRYRRDGKWCLLDLRNIL